MHADKAGRGKHPSVSLRTSQPSTTKLSESDKLMGTLTHRPEFPEEGDSVAIQLPADDAGNSLRVRPASRHAVQVTGDLSRFSKKLRDSREEKTNKRTQSEAGIGEEDGDNGRMSKRQRTADTNSPRLRGLADVNANPISEPAPDAGPQRVVQPGAAPAPQPIAQPMVLVPEPPFSITPAMQAQFAAAEALLMVKSITPFQPDKISELFQHLQRTQLWPLLKIEEQRMQHLMNMYSFLPATYGVASVTGAGAVVANNVPSSSTTTITAMQPASSTAIPPAGGLPASTNPVAQRVSNPVPINRPPVPPAPAAGNNVSKIDVDLLPKPPNPVLPNHARYLLSMLPEEVQRLTTLPAEEITSMLTLHSRVFANINSMTNFACALFEIVSHGGLLHLTGKLDGVVQALLECYLMNHRRLEGESSKARKAEGESKNSAASKAEGSKKRHTTNNPAHAYLLRLLTQFPQFARTLGEGINKMQRAHRTHLGLARKFNAVLDLMSKRHSLSDARFKTELDAIIDQASPKPSSGGAKASTPTSVPAKRREDDSDEGSDGDI